MARAVPRERNGGTPRLRNVATISFDIEGHSIAPAGVMLARIAGIGRFAGRAMEAHGRGRVLWLSGGDGGHLVFLAGSWREPLLQEVENLCRWAEEDDVPLRVAVHHGGGRILETEAGRQVVGDVINDSAAILTRGSAAGIVASSQFREAIGPMPDVEFHDERQLRLKHGRPQLLYLMSLSRDGGGRSQWSDAVEEDRQELLRAVAEGRGFDAIYYAKRVLQTHSDDPDVADALTGVGPLHFRYQAVKGKETVNKVLGHLSPGNLRRLIGSGQLVERRYNQVICRQGETGNTMFVILRGQVGVYSAEEGAKPDPARPRVTLSEGEIVGELAFALNGVRTADLVALGDTAMLSFEYEEVSSLLNGKGEMIWEHMRERALEHISQNVPYLIGRQLGTLPEAEQRRWRGHLSTLQSSCDIITPDAHRPVTLADLRRRHRHTDRRGIYILASGHLRSLSTADKELDGEGFPLLYVDLPGLVVGPDHEYTVDRDPARIVFIGMDAIDQLPWDLRASVVANLKRAMHSLYHYDVFLAHNFADGQTVDRWEQALSDLGLRVFRDSPMPGEPFAAKDLGALLDSLTMVVFVSPHVMAKKLEQNWVVVEERFREKHFSRNPRIVPVRLLDGDPQALGMLHSPVETDGGEAGAIQKVAAIVRAIRTGEQEPPYGLYRPAGARIA